MGACVGSWDAGRPRWACTQRPPFNPAQEASPLDGTATRRAARPLVSNAPLPSWEHNNLSWAGGGGCGRRHLETRSPRCAGDILASARPAVGKPPLAAGLFFLGAAAPGSTRCCPCCLRGAAPQRAAGCAQPAAAQTLSPGPKPAGWGDFQEPVSPRATGRSLTRETSLKQGCAGPATSFCCACISLCWQLRQGSQLACTNPDTALPGAGQPAGALTVLSPI